MCKRRAARGFTLIELLVVVTIIVALLAILMPSMANAVRAAGIAQCSSNLHQQYLAMVDYAGDHLGAMPNVAGTTAYNNLANVYGGLRPGWDPPRFPTLKDRLLNPYAGGAENGIWVCPDDPQGKPLDSRAVPMPPARGVYHAVWGNSYQYNIFLVRAPSAHGIGSGKYTRLSQIQGLGRAWVFQEWPAWDVMINYTSRSGYVGAGNDRWSFHDPMGSPGNPDATGNLTAFGDGHTSMVDYQVGVLDGEQYTSRDLP